MIVKSDNKAVKQELVKLKDIILEAGGWLYEGLQVCCEGDQVSLKVEEPVADIDYLIKLPEELLIPINAINLTIENDLFVVSPDETVLSPVQIKVAAHIIEVFNLLDRVKFHKDSNPWVLYKNKKELLEPFIKARSSYYDLQQRLDYFYDKPEAMSEEEFICWVFMKSHVLGYINEKGDFLSEVLMPFITFLNHDYRGTPYFYENNDDQQRFLCVKNQQPHLHESECFACYGIYDGLDSFVHHGYVDVDVPYVRSVPTYFEIEGHGEIVLHANVGKNYEGRLPETLQDLSAFMPRLEKLGEDTLSVSHLIIPSRFSPHALRRILRFIINTYIGANVSPEFVIEQTYKFEKHVVATNIDFYKGVLRELEQKTEGEDLIQPLKILTNVQLNKLYKYHFNPEFFKR